MVNQPRNFHTLGGLNGNRVRRETHGWTQQRMLDELARIKGAGEPINPGSLQLNHGAFYQAVKNKPGGWSGLIEQAGLDPQIEAKGTLRYTHIQRER